MSNYWGNAKVIAKTCGWCVTLIHRGMKLSEKNVKLLSAGIIDWDLKAARKCWSRVPGGCPFLQEVQRLPTEEMCKERGPLN